MRHLPWNLRYYRQALALSLQNVADELDVHRSLIHQYEHGHTTPSVERLAQLAEVFGVSTDQLIEKRVR